MSVFFLLFFIFIGSTTSIFSQDTVSDTIIEFPTINLDGDPDQMALDYCEKEPDNMKPNLKKKSNQLEPATNYGFYTDIIVGTIVLIVGWIGWKAYQRFRPEA